MLTGDFPGGRPDLRHCVEPRMRSPKGVDVVSVRDVALCREPGSFWWTPYEDEVTCPSCRAELLRRQMDEAEKPDPRLSSQEWRP